MTIARGSAHASKGSSPTRGSAARPELRGRTRWRCRLEAAGWRCRLEAAGWRGRLQRVAGTRERVRGVAAEERGAELVVQGVEPWPVEVDGVGVPFLVRVVRREEAHLGDA